MTMQQYGFDLFTFNLIVVHKQWSTTFSFELIIVRWTETSLLYFFIETRLYVFMVYNEKITSRPFEGALLGIARELSREG